MHEELPAPLELSIVSTLYQSASYLLEFYTRCCAAAERLTPNFEMILVDDGSPDDSLTKAIELYTCDPRVRVIDLSRNFGHHKAIMTGLAHARGKLVFLIDSDLEVAPEVLPTFYATLHESKADVVYGIQRTRHDGWMDRIASRLFYLVFNWLSAERLPVNLVTTRLMSRRYVMGLVAHQEREVLIGGLWVATGFKQVPLAVDKTNKGTTSYTWVRRFAVLVNGIASFSNKPLVMIFYLGIIISLLAGLAALYVMAQRVFLGIVSEGWLSLIISTWLLGGLIIFCLGIIAIYLSKLFSEAKQRPYTIIREVYERSPSERR